MNFLKKHWWKSSYKLPASFIIFFVLFFFLVGTQLPSLPNYLGIHKGPDAVVHILDKAAPDALHQPIAYFILAAIDWAMLRFLAWPLAWLIVGGLWTFDQVFVSPGEPGVKLSVKLSFTLSVQKIIAVIGGFIGWGVLGILPYILFRWIDKKWGRNGIWKSILILFLINLLLFGFFAYQIFVRHNSHRSYPREQSSQSHQGGNNSNNSNDQQSNSSVVIAEKSLITPLTKESDIASVNEAYSTTNNSGWGFEHGGIDFMTGQDLIPFRAVTDGVVESVQLYQLENTHNWQVGVTLIHGKSALIYGFETFSSDKNAGEVQLKNIAVQRGQKLQQGDLIGRLHKAGNGAHVHFGVVPDGRDASGQKCPEPYFTDDARDTILRIIHKDHPDWRMCYE